MFDAFIDGPVCILKAQWRNMRFAGGPGTYKSRQKTTETHNTCRQSRIPAGRRSARESAVHVAGDGAITPKSAGKDFTSQGSPEI